MNWSGSNVDEAAISGASLSGELDPISVRPLAKRFVFSTLSRPAFFLQQVLRLVALFLPPVFTTPGRASVARWRRTRRNISPLTRCKRITPLVTGKTSRLLENSPLFSDWETHFSISDVLSFATPLFLAVTRPSSAKMKRRRRIPALPSRRTRSFPLEKSARTYVGWLDLGKLFLFVVLSIEWKTDEDMRI